MVLALITAFIFLLFFMLQMDGLSSSITESLFVEKLKGDLNSVNKYIYEYYGSIHSNADSLYDARWNSIANDYVFIDRLKNELNVEVSIFIKQDDDFIRMTTTIFDLDGVRAVGTWLGKDSVAYQSVIRGKSYIGKADILGVEYLTGYQPIFAGDNEIIGLVFIGIPFEAAQNHTAHIFNHTIMFVIITVIICIIVFCVSLYAVIWYFERKT